jgi:3-hydroxyacyl-[acyl-carrier-protein] dehydratase
MAPEGQDVAVREAEAFPFLLVDKVLGSVSGERAVGVRNVTANDPLLAGGGRRPHTMRRSLLVEAFSQLVAMALGPDPKRPEAVEVTRIESMRFERSPVPGDQIVLNVEITREGSAVKSACTAEIAGQRIAEGALQMQVLPRE